ncbi:MAG TPA: response regulator [Oscillatoriales cyanobacterium M59_W2019_021]|nr:MAG: response regulator [Cyanobacteria bacterium J055]HIK30102.1 response regulator [Oscillatoriales cyanobacterium M4454_W2019_049]HIK51228.1 response regulator [Oscillatoriales cyanobacterium M59_W2019_021]
MKSTPETQTILIVDDNPTNLEILSGTLTDSGWEILVAVDGESAIEQARYAHPDMIVLDVMMPGIDGFETCRRLKADPALRDIPVIFMTALVDTTDKVKGLNLGAVDYITKPFQQEEVLARVKTHLQIRQLTKQLQQEITERIAAEVALQQANQELERRVEERTEKLAKSEAQLRLKTQELENSLEDLKQTQFQLVQAEKISSLGQLVAGVAHEVNNPLGFISGNLSHVKEYICELFEILKLYEREHPNLSADTIEELEDADLDFLREDLPKMLESMQVGVERIQGIMSSLRTFTRADKDDKQLADIHAGLESTLMILQHRLKANPQRPAIQVKKEYDNLPLVRCYGGQLNQVFMNVLANAIDALEECSQGKSFAELKASPNIIHIKTEAVGDRIYIRIADNGKGMDEETQNQIFESFYTTKPAGKGTGLGLSISRQILRDKHGGDLTCLSTLGRGTEFTIEFPLLGD